MESEGDSGIVEGLRKGVVGGWEQFGRWTFL